MTPTEVEHELIVRLHEAQQTRELAEATFAMFARAIPHQLLFLALDIGAICQIFQL